MRYELIQHICWHVEGKKLNPDKVNPVIGDFHTLLDNLKFKHGSISASPTAVDEFFCEEIDTTLLRGKYQIRWEIIDNEPGWENRQNNVIRPELTRFVEEIEMENGLTYGKKITVRMVNSRFDGDLKNGLWPREAF